MNQCLACLHHADTFLELDDHRMNRFIQYSSEFYDGLLHSSVDAVVPQLVRCRMCGHVSYRKMPSDDFLSAMYSFERPRKNNPSRPPTREMVKKMRKYFILVGKRAPIMLDYGAGYGRWSVAAAQAGFQVIAYDPHGVRTTVHPDYELYHDLSDIPQLKYDFIFCEQVLEHSKDPLTVLEEIKTVANMETIVRISVPNVKRAKEGKKIWSLWPYNGAGESHTMAPYQHLQGFGQSSLQLLCQRAGFKNLGAGKLLANFPIHLLRVLLGRAFRRFSTTVTYVVLSKN